MSEPADRRSRHTIKRLTGVVLACLLVAAACGGTASPPTTVVPPSTTIADFDDAATALQAARDRWAASDLETYSYRYSEDCPECPSPAQRDAVVWDGEELDPGDRNPSVEELFAELAAAIEQGALDEVVYHPELGIPTRAAIAGSTPTEWVIEDVAAELPGDGVDTSRVDAAAELWRLQRPDAYSYTVSVLCDCDLAQSLRTVVVGDTIVDWEAAFDPTQDERLTPMSIDDVLRDVRDLIAAGETGLEGDDFTFSGSARFDPALGYPTWIGLEIVPAAGIELAALGLPPRLVFVLSDMTTLDATEAQPAPSDELAAARETWQNRTFGSYTYELTVHDVMTAGFRGPYLVIVLANEVESVTLGGELVDHTMVPHLTVEDLFDLAETQIEQGLVGVLFHSELGHPVLVEHRDGELLAIANLESLR